MYSSTQVQKEKMKEVPFTRLMVTYEGEPFPIDDVVVTKEKNVNEHTKAIIKGRAKQDVLDKLVLTTSTNTNLECVYEHGKDKLLLFSGIIVSMEAETEGIEANAVHYLVIEALSYTYVLDIEYKTRSFQDANMTYDRLLETVLSEYSGSDCVNVAARGETLNGLTIQYQETDWEFLKRMASRFYAPLIANHTFKSPKFSLGMQPGSTVTKLENVKYKAIKKVDTYRSNAHNYRSGINEADYLYYEVTTAGTDTKSLEIGDTVLYKGNTYYVYSARATVKHHVLSHTYRLSTKNGFFVPPIFNETITGLTIQGTVIKVSRNLLKVRLDIDPAQPVETAYWFKYSTFYATWYCMPEIGDRVNVHFATKDESDAVVINSIKHASSGGGFQRKSPETSASQVGGAKAAASVTEIPAAAAPAEGASAKKSNFDFEALASDNKVKMIVTAGGKMIILDDNSSSVSIVCNDNTYVRLTDGNGLSIVTDMDITFESKADINFTAEEMIFMKAKEKIALECGDSLLELTPEEIKVKGTDIKMNQ